jgi:hypothetical protein
VYHAAVPRYLLGFTLAVALCTMACVSPKREPAPPSVHEASCSGEAASPSCTNQGSSEPAIPRRDAAAIAAQLAAACPPPAEDDPTPGLSPGGRLSAPPKPPPGVRCILRAPAELEAAEYTSLLRATPRDHPDRPKVMDRLADTFFRMEYDSYQSCRELRAPEPGDESGLASFEQNALIVTRRIREAREASERTCATLRSEYPAYIANAPCPGTLAQAGWQ